MANLKLESSQPPSSAELDAELELELGPDAELGPGVELGLGPESSQPPKITKLAAGVRNPERVNVFINGKFALSLDVAQVVDLRVKVGQAVDETRRAELMEASVFGKVYQRALEWCLVRPRTTSELKNYFYQKGLRLRQLNRQRAREQKKALPEISDKVKQLVTERLIERGYLDDQKFARFYIENRFVNKGISQKRLKMELKKKGLSEATIEAALAEIPRDEMAELQKMIAKKRAKYDDAKLLAYLVRQGFDYQMAKDAISESYEPDSAL